MNPTAKQLVCLLYIFAALMTTGCVEVPKFPTIEPVSFKPSTLSARGAVDVDSLTPTFTWKTSAPGNGAAETYDFAIWEVQNDGSVGEVVTHKEGIFGTSYTLDTPLQPSREYYWSVKKSSSSVWASISFVGVSPIGANWGHGQPFKIKTPKLNSSRVVVAFPKFRIPPSLRRSFVPVPARPKTITVN